jgi:hypothetical protein
MSRSYVYRLLLVIACAVPLIAADQWQAKKYTEWTQQEVTKVLTDSPWAKAINSTDANAVGRGGGRFGGGGGGGRGGRGGGGEPGGGGPPATVPQLRVVVRWASALPVKQAQVRSRAASEALTPEQTAAALSPTADYYVLAIEGLPLSSVVDQSAAAVLNRKDKWPINVERVTVGKAGENQTVMFWFPKKSAIALADKEVEFVGRIGRLEFKNTFKLKDMVYQGNLEL